MSVAGPQMGFSLTAALYILYPTVAREERQIYSNMPHSSTAVVSQTPKRAICPVRKMMVLKRGSTFAWHLDFMPTSNRKCFHSVLKLHENLEPVSVRTDEAPMKTKKYPRKLMLP